MFSIEDIIQRVMATPMSMSNYVAATRMNQWGVSPSQVEIFATANLLKTHIFLYTKVGNNWRWIEYSPNIIGHSNTSSMSIYIHHKNQNHFEPDLNVTASQVQTPNADWYTKYLENQRNAKKKQGIFWI
jgi:hypothetical protein